MTQDPQGYGTNYTIEQALQLMRELPLEGMNEKLIISVMRSTLESAGVSIPNLLSMSNERQDQITNEIVRLQGEIASLNEAIQQKTAQVQAYQEGLADIGSLRERFE
ncbi:MAG: hypothetical protein GY847_27775 [Proteobacteria bacterium]|nr:hypothetical protein [Pseudomonadota bacterium]